MAARKRGVEFVDEARDKPVLVGLPSGYRNALSEDLARLVRGEDALQSRPLHGFGAGIVELKRGGCRVVLALTDDRENIWVVCVFVKDAKQGKSMRPEHRRLIESGLRRLRSARLPASAQWH
jgi:phage-related protein